MRPRLALLALCALCLLVATEIPAAALARPEQGRGALLVDLSSADVATQMLVTSIQGVINRDPAPPIGYPGIYVARGPADLAWLSIYRPEITPVTADELVAKVRDRLAGQVLYDPEQAHSVDLAAAAAAILDAVLTTKDVGLKTLLDARGRWPDRAAAYRYAIAEVLPHAAPDRIALVGSGQRAGVPVLQNRADLRDYLAKERVLAVDLDWRDAEQASLLKEILTRLRPGSLVFGAPELAGDEGLLQVLASRQDVLAPVSYAANLSWHSSYRATAPMRQLDRLAPLAYKVMVTFVYEGGSDFGFALGRMRALWYDPGRGKVALGWTISPALLDLAPQVYQSYCADAWMSGTDELVMAPNGPGYFLPSGWNPGTLAWGPLVERMAPWARAGDLQTVAIGDSGPARDLQRALVEYQNAGLRGALLGPGSKLASGVYGDLPVVAQTVRATDPFETLTAIRKAGETDKYVYVSVDPASVTPTDIAYIAGRLGENYLVLRPREFLEVARQTTATHAQKPKQGEATIGDILLRPSAPGPADEVEVRATISSATKLDSVLAVYTVAGGHELAALMKPGPDDSYSGSLPPVLISAPVSVRVRAVDANDGVTWSDRMTFEVAAPDADGDGMSDALERFRLTDPNNPDTDGDGWRDGNDDHPLTPDHYAASYVWPLAPPGDAPYIVAGGGAVKEGVRVVTGDEKVEYELPLALAPPESRPMLEAVVGGDYLLQASSDGAKWQDIGSSTSDAPFTGAGWDVPADYLARESFRVRMSVSKPGRAETPAAPSAGSAQPSAPQSAASPSPIAAGAPEAGRAARLAALDVIADPAGPSILVIGTQPAHPAAGLPIRVAATVFDPDGASGVRLNYRINDGGTIGVPMHEREKSQIYIGEVHGALEGDDVTFWVSATDGKQNPSASRPRCFHIGVVAQEAISLLALRDFEGPWQLGAEWDGSRWSSAKDAVDTAKINIMGGAYRVWVLAAPRGGSVRAAVDGKTVGATDGKARDGWQSVGTIDLAPGAHVVTLTATDDARTGYAQVVLTRDRSWTPPQGLVRDLYNSVTIISPRPDDMVKGVVEIEATATGNVWWVECTVDGQSIGRQNRPPYHFRWNARDARAGKHTVEARAYDRTGELMLTTAMEVEVAR